MKIAVRYLSNCIARVQITPDGVDCGDSALNRYHFINEPDCADHPAFSVDEQNGLIVCRDGAGRVLFQMTGATFNKKYAAISFKAQEDEDWVGFGDQTRKRIYHRGYKATCWVSNVASYVPVPFFMSTNGYSILVNTTHCVVFDMCATLPDTFGWKDERAVIDFYVLLSPTFKDGLRHYMELTGRPKLPPEWSFGLWYICRTQANDVEVINDAVNLRREKIPCDLIGLEPGWMEVNYDLSLEKNWSTQRFPLPDWQKKSEVTFIKALHRMGFKLELWLCIDYDLTYEEERKIQAETSTENDRCEGIFDEKAELDLHFCQPKYLDTFTKKDEPWFHHLERFVDWGADMFKQDGGYQICTHPDRLYGNGMIDDEMHNLYPLMYSRQMWEGFAKYANRRPVVFTCSGWSGFQSWSGTWTGDTGGGYDTLCAMLNTSLMGHCWATNDMEVTTPEGIHFGYLQPWSQINSWTYFRMPWIQGDTLLQLHKYYANLRSRLIPYIYSSAYDCTQNCVPLMRPLTLEYQDDIECRSVLNEYLLGRDLLVVSFKHDVYLPEGKWVDYWTGKTYEGRQHLEYNWPEGKGGGLFVREGAIITMGPVMQYRKEMPLDRVTLYLFPSEKESSFALYEDDGVSFKYLDGAYSLSTITTKLEGNAAEVSISRGEGSEVKEWELVMHLPFAPQHISCDGKPVASAKWDAARNELTFVVPASATKMTIQN